MRNKYLATIVGKARGYSRPFTREELKNMYTADEYTSMMNTPVLAWRADTGIEIMHDVGNEKELDWLWCNWNAMNKEQKDASDKKCKELFSRNNYQMYLKLKSDLKFRSK